jgi:HEAT repeat protein
MKPFDINYRSAEKFFQDYLQLKEGKLFVVAEEPFPPKTQLAVNFPVPRIDYTFQLDGTVLKIRDRETAEKLEKPSGMLVHFEEDLKSFFKKLDEKLLVDEKYQFLLALCETINDEECIIGEDIDEAGTEDDETPSAASTGPSDQNSGPEADDDSPAETQSQTEAPAVSAHEDPAEQTADETHQKDGSYGSGGTSDLEKANLNFDWLREAIAQEEELIEDEPPPEIEAPPTQDKKNLTPEERFKVKPAAEFIMDLTKAMLRSGYYSPEHPGTQEAKKGLYSNFVKCLGDSQEIMITNVETPKKKDILITGILDEPVSVRTLVGAGMAELFVPKLTEVFNRKGLMSFAIKKEISPSHFECYIDIMSDPKADRGENHKMGEMLTKALARNGIKEISTIFMDDIIVLETNLPWRVEMAIQRLTKDLKIMPMFKEKSDDAILRMKIKIIHDIIRPLKYGEYLKELLVNCYIIAKYVDNIEAEDIEEIIINGIPQHLLLATAVHVFEDLKDLADLKSKEHASGALERRHEGVKRIIKSLSRRMIHLKIKGVQRFLEELHHTNVLAFSELPPDVRYLVNTMKMVRDIQSRTSVYIGWVFKRLNPDDAAVMLKCFRRVITIIVEDMDWDICFKITLAVNKVKSETDLYSPKNKLPSNPFYFVFKDASYMLATAYLSEPTASRLKIDQIVRRLGTKGVDILCMVLTKSENSEVRTDAMETIVNMGEVARHWSLQALGNKKSEVGEVKNALAILREVGKAKKDTDIVRKFINHADPRVQEELLHTLMRFNAPALEPFIMQALTNSDDKLRWRAASALGKLPQISKDSLTNILQTITSDPPDDDQQAEAHIRKVAQLIQTLGTVNNFPALDRLELAIIRAAQKSNNSGKKLMARLKLKNPATDQTPILVAAFATLGKIGSARSSELLSNFTKGKSPVTAEAQKALKLIESRLVTKPTAQATG